MKFAIIALLVIRLAHADMTILKKGDVAPYDGILSDAAQMKEFRQINEDKKILSCRTSNLKIYLLFKMNELSFIDLS